MKRCAYLFALVGVLAAGCLVQSYQPFYTGKSPTTLPDLLGSWKLVTDCGKPFTNQTAQAWAFTELEEHTYTLLTYDEEQRPGNLAVVFFKVGDQLFADFTATGEQPACAYWGLHTTPVHMVCKAQLKDGTLTFWPLSYEWLAGQVKEKKLVLPYLDGEKEGVRLYTAAPADWEQALAVAGKNAEAFPDKLMYVLKKTKP